MVADPKRKTRQILCLGMGIAGSFLAGCASHEPAGAPAKRVAPAPVAEKAPEARPMPPPPNLVLGPSSPRSVRYEAAPEKLPEEWIYRKPPQARPPLSLFEESILLGQVRSTAKTLPEAAKIQTLKVQNRTVLLGVSPDITSVTAARIGETLLQKTRLDEVRIQSLK